jgi:hypothetical protein
MAIELQSVLCQSMPEDSPGEVAETKGRPRQHLLGISGAVITQMKRR